MPANQVSINLLDVEGNSNSVWNRIMIWITTYGRYIMITTELIVLLAFASRFSLDRKLSDLKENITQKQEILEVNAGLEKEIRDVQDKTTAIKTLIQEQPVPVETLTLIHILVPLGVNLNSLTIDKDKIKTDVTANSSDSFTKFLSNFSATNKLSGVEIGKVNKGPSGIHFSLTATIPKTQPAKRN